MVSFDYAFYHVERVWKMAFGDEDALNDMDITAEGFWRSFWAILYALPAMFFGWVIDSRDLIAAGSTHAIGYLVSTNGLMEMAVWLIPVLLLALILKPLGFANRFSHLVIARNWFSVIAAYFYALLSIPALFIADYETPVLIIFVALFFMIFLMVRITKLSLQSDSTMASGLVIGEFIFMVGFMTFWLSASGMYDGVTAS